MTFFAEPNDFNLFKIRRNPKFLAWLADTPLFLFERVNLSSPLVNFLHSISYMHPQDEDQEILVNRLQNTVGLRGTVLNWFRSYLSNRSKQIAISGILSACFNLDCGVPQGSCLGPLLFIIYSSQLFNVKGRPTMCLLLC